MRLQREARSGDKPQKGHPEPSTGVPGPGMPSCKPCWVSDPLVTHTGTMPGDSLQSPGPDEAAERGWQEGFIAAIAVPPDCPDSRTDGPVLPQRGRRRNRTEPGAGGCGFPNPSNPPNPRSQRRARGTGIRLVRALANLAPNLAPITMENQNAEVSGVSPKPAGREWPHCASSSSSSSSGWVMPAAERAMALIQRCFSSSVSARKVNTWRDWASWKRCRDSPWGTSRTW